MRWQPILLDLPDILVLYLPGTTSWPVARINQRVDQRWHLTVNYQRPAWSDRQHAYPANRRQGQRWAERWAAANLQRLQAEVDHLSREKAQQQLR